MKKKKKNKKYDNTVRKNIFTYLHVINEWTNNAAKGAFVLVRASVAKLRGETKQIDKDTHTHMHILVKHVLMFKRIRRYDYWQLPHIQQMSA